MGESESGEEGYEENEFDGQDDSALEALVLMEFVVFFMVEDHQEAHEKVQGADQDHVNEHHFVLFEVDEAHGLGKSSPSHRQCDEYEAHHAL